MADTQTIKDRIDIADLIREYVPLKKAGANWKANCPFHHEKSPSFMVHPEKQIWHCFGCNKGGDIFSFVQEIEGLDFVEALKLLGKRAGVPVDTFRSEVDQSVRNRVMEINSAAAYFYNHFLSEMPAATPAREYLKQRGLKSETIKEWQVGFIPDQWDLLTKYLLKKGHGIDDLVASGLTIKREGADAASGRGVYDRFRGRIMFPICDAHSSVVGFTGRVLVETETSGGKYVNTPQTVLYDKSRVLYGIEKAKSEIKSKDLAVLVEGQMDVIACHQAGMRNVVAASGTALTPEQIKLLKRYTNNIAMAFDADSAGENAGKRGIGVALEEGMNIKVIQVPADVGKDADECLKKNPAAWFKAVVEATPAIAWYFKNTLKQLNPSDPRQKQQAVNILLPEIARVPFAVERDDWLKQLGDLLAIEPSILREALKKLPRSDTGKVVGSVESRPTSTPSVSMIETPETKLQAEFWSLILKFPDIYGSYHDNLKEEYFRDTPFLNLYEKVRNLYTNSGHLDIGALRQSYDIAGAENYIDVLALRPYKDVIELNGAAAKREVGVLLERIKSEHNKRRRQQLQQEISAAEKAGLRERVEILLKELQLL